MAGKINDKLKRLIEELYFKNLSLSEIIEKVNVSYATIYGCTRAKERGFSSRNEYQEYLAKKRGFMSYDKYQKYLSKKRGFVSLSEYRKYLAEHRQKKLENQELSNLIRRRLKELVRNQSWLAKELSISREAVSKYKQGKYMPSEEILEKLFFILKVPYRTLDDLLE